MGTPNLETLNLPALVERTYTARVVSREQHLLITCLKQIRDLR